MKLRQVVLGGGAVLAMTTSTFAGGMFVPGSGAVSTSRAGAAVASADDGEALSINPAGLAKSDGLKLTIAATVLRYYMKFSRRGSYDPITLEDRPYEGDNYATVTNDPSPPQGLGSYQPLPVLVVSYKLPQLPKLTVAGGLYTPQGYPFRDMSQGYKFQTSDTANYDAPPPPTRYDVMSQESALLLPAIAAAYRILPNLDVGARFAAGNLKSKTTVVVWGTPGNVEEDIKKDALFTADVKDNFIPAFGLGATYRIGPAIELGAAFNGPIAIHAKGTAQALRGPSVDDNREIGPVPDDEAICQGGGTMDKQRACISLQLPMNATLGGRYKFLDGNGEELGDVELDVDWENWGKTCNFDDAHIVGSDCTAPGQYRVQIDAGLYTNGQYQTKINDTSGANVVNLGLKDTFGVRLGGSYKHRINRDSRVIGRAGLALDTRAAKDGWLRANFDGAPRQMLAAGGAYEGASWQVNVGFAYVHEGTNTNSGTCNPTEMTIACNSDGTMTPPDQRNHPDPTNPLLTPDTQFENPYNEGSITSHYLMFMLGFTKGW